MATKRPMNRKDGSGKGQQGGRNTNKGGCSKSKNGGKSTGKGKGGGSNRLG